MSKHRRPRATVTADSRTTDPASQSPDSTTPDNVAVGTETRTADRTGDQAAVTATARTRRQQRALDRAKARADKAYARDRAALAAARAEAGRPEIDYDADPDTITEPKTVGYEITLWRLNPLDTDATDETGEPTQAHESAEAFPDADSDTDAAPEAGSTAAPETTRAPHPEAHEPVITYADLYEGPATHTTENTDAAEEVHSTPTTHVADNTDNADDTDDTGDTGDFEGDGTMLDNADHDTTHPDHPLHLDTHFSRARARQARLDARAQARAQAAAAAILARREKQAAKALARIERAEKKQAAAPTRTPAHPAGEAPAPLAVTDVPEVEDTQGKAIQVEAPVASVETDNPDTDPDTAYTVTHTQRTHTVPLTTTAPAGDRTADRGTDRAAARAAAKAAKAAARTERLAAKAAAREAARAARAEKKAARAAAKAAARQARADAKAAKKNKNRSGLTNPFAQRANDYDQFATGLSTAAVSGFTTPRPGEAITPDLPPLPVDEMLASFDTASNSGAYTGAPDELGFTDADTWTGHDTDPHHSGGVINQATWTPPPVPGLDTSNDDGIDPETGQPFDLITRVTDHPDYDPTFDAAEHLAHHTDTSDTDGTVRAGETYGREFALTTNITTELHDTPDTADDTADNTADDEPDEPAPTPLATITSTINATSRRGRRKADIEAELAARQSDYDAMFSATTTEAPSTPGTPAAPGAPAAVTGTDTPGTAAPGTLRDALNNPRTLPTHLKQHPRHLAAAAATALALLGLTGYLLTAPAADQATATNATLPTTNTAPASPVDTPLLIDLNQDNAADTTLTTTAPDGTTLDINIPDTTRDRALITTALPPTQDTTTTNTGTGAATTTTRTLATALVPATDPWWLTIRNMAPDLTTWSNNTPAAAPRKTRWFALTTSPRTPNHPAYNHLHLGFTTAEAAKKYADKINPDLATATLRGTVLTLTHPDTTTYNPTWPNPTPEQAQALDNLKPTVGTWTINYGHATDPAYRASTLLATLGYGPGTIWTAIADNPTSPWIGNLTAHTPPHKGATLDTALTGQETVLTNLLTASGYTTKNDTLGKLPAPTLDEGPTGTVLAYALAAATTPWDLTSDTLAGTQGTNPTGAPSRIWVTNNGTQVIDTP